MEGEREREMKDLPIDIIVDILLRLPVKSLLRFRCVSKQLHALIDSRAFMRLHLKRSIDTKNHLSLILANNILRSIDFDSLGRVVELNHPFKSEDSVTKVWGYCHGVVCLGNSKRDLAIWNPSTQRSQQLPSMKIDFPGSLSLDKIENICYGFGYDSASDDYKVVMFVEVYSRTVTDSFASEVKVYNMKSNSWRSIQDFPYWFCDYQSRGVLIGSALHWIVSRKPVSDTVKLVAAFDLAAEDYQLVPLPEFSGGSFCMHLVELGGCLCIICTYNRNQNDIWVMKDYRVKESWSKLFSTAQPEEIWSFRYVFPLAYSKSGRQVLLVQNSKDTQELVWYDIEQKKIKTTKTRATLESFLCVESLVPLNGGGKT